MPVILIPVQYLNDMTLEQLQGIATKVGVGYADLGEAALREKLIREGMPTEE